MMERLPNKKKKLSGATIQQPLRRQMRLHGHVGEWTVFRTLSWSRERVMDCYYTSVSNATSEVICTCPGFEHAGHCKHVAAAARAYIRRQKRGLPL